jgi:hypothetical protein
MHNAPLIKTFKNLNMKNAALRKLVEEMGERSKGPGNDNKKIIQNLSEEFYNKEQEKQKKNKITFSEEESLTR